MQSRMSRRNRYIKTFDPALVAAMKKDEEA
jgi:hypothetical protein